MHFKLKGTTDCSLIITKKTDVDKARELARQIIDNGLEFKGYITDAEVDKLMEYKKYYESMHPKMTLNEDYISDSITTGEIIKMFDKFFVPLDAANCQVTVVDQYIFSNGIDVALLTDIIKKNVTSLKVRFLTKQSNEVASVKNNIINVLSTFGFSVHVDYDNNLHDRWWYTRVNGFTTGISFNGFSRKESTMKMLDQSELNNIILKHGI